MQIKEAILIFERCGVSDDPLLSFDEFDKFELYSYLLKTENIELTAKDQERAETLLKIKISEYNREIAKGNKFIELLDIGIEENHEPKTKGMNQTLKYLSELCLYLAMNGISNYHEMSVYEAHRMYGLAYKAAQERKIDD